MSFSELFAGARLIHAYTRAQAIADGVLMDVSELAEEAGFRVPVALTAAVWADCVAWPAADGTQDETGRLWDVLYMASLAARRGRDEQVLTFELLRIPRPHAKAELVQLVMHVGPGDHLEPVITILQPGED